MKKNGLFIVAFLVIAAAAAYLYFTNSGGSTLRGEYQDFAVEDTASVTKIFMADKNGNRVTLEKVTNKKWTLNGSNNARLDAVTQLLSTMHHLRVKAPVSKASFETIVKRLASNSTKVEIYQGGDSPSKVYYVGGPNQTHTGTYMLMENSTVPFLMYIEGFYGYLTTRYFTNPNDWRTREVFAYNYGDIQKVEVLHPKTPEESFSITDQGDHNSFVLADGQGRQFGQVDSMRMKAYLTRYKRINYESFEETKSSEYRDSVLATTPVQIYRVTNFDGDVREIKTWLKPLPGGEDLDGNPSEIDIDRMYGLINDDDFVVIQYFVFDPLALRLSDFTLK